MKVQKKILAIWLLALGSFIISCFVFPDKGDTISGFIVYALQLLLFIISIYIVRREPTKKNKYIFINFALFFSLSVLFHLFRFVPDNLIVVGGKGYARFFFTQYISLGAYFFFLAFAIVYVAIDALFRDFKAIYKYVATFVIVGGFFGYYYSPYFVNPIHAYTTEDVLDWKILDLSFSAYHQQWGVEPTPEDLAEYTELHSWNNGEPVGTLYPAEKARRINELFPYLAGTNYMVLVSKPLYMNTIYMCVVCVGFIVLFFGYQYMKDPPQGAYLDKIMFLFLIFCTLEILHAWSFVKSVEWESFYEIGSMGQVVSIVVLFFISIFLGLRLRFINSVKGEFYEQEILAGPSGITRWRDGLDNLVIAQFFDRKKLFGRMFVDPSRK